MTLSRTPLHEWHVAHGGRMVEFGGWEMPVQYSGIVLEHRAVREAAGIFDVSHMGELRVRGRGALALLQELVTNDVSRLEPGQALYSPMCREDGGTLDDLLVYRLDADDYLVVVNASNSARDLDWIGGHAREVPDASVRDETRRWALVAVQGPDAQRILEPLCTADLASLGSFRVAVGARLAGVDGCLIARTGYTGEDGFECYVPWERAVPAWEAVMEAGRARGLLPCGLGARDTLRLEAALPLYGHELSEEINPLEARLGPFVKLEKGSFVGREALATVKERGPARRLIGLVLREPGIARHGYPVYRDGGEPEAVGFVTSGTHSPTTGQSVALALVGGGARIGERMAVMIRGRRVAAEVVKLPFYRRSDETGRAVLSTG